MNILLIAGHGAGDPGALGNGYREEYLTREAAKAIKDLLLPYACVKVYDTDRNAYADLKNGISIPFFLYDYVLELHFNAFPDASGTEIYVPVNEKETTVEEKMLQGIVSFGFKNRGVKRKDFNVIAAAKKAGVSAALLEFCFITSESDMERFANKKALLYHAVANAVIEGFGLRKNADTKRTSADEIAIELNKNHFPITDMPAFIQTLAKAKLENSPLYWGYYKLANRIKA